MSHHIGVAILGTGRISDMHALEYLNNPKARIVALCDQRVELARQRAAAWRLEDVVISDDYEEILTRADVDLVEILLPHDLHLPVALAAIAAGKAVSVQKPLGRTLEEADQLVAAAATAPKPFKLFENFVFHPPVRKAARLIKEGAIGEPLSIRIKSNPGRSRTAWKVPRGALAWRQRRDQSGGGPLVFDDGHHKFALAWHFMGNPSRVHAYISSTEVSEREVLDAPAIISFCFPRNRIGNFEVVYSPDLEIVTRHYAQDDRIEITGTAGVIWINCGHGRLGDPPPLMLYRDQQVTTYHDMDTGWEQSFILSTRHYLDVLVNHGEPYLTAEQGREVLRFALAAEESARLGESVELA